MYGLKTTCVLAEVAIWWRSSCKVVIAVLLESVRAVVVVRSSSTTQCRNGLLSAPARHGTHGRIVLLRRPSEGPSEGHTVVEGRKWFLPPRTQRWSCSRSAWIFCDILQYFLRERAVCTFHVSQYLNWFHHYFWLHVFSLKHVKDRSFCHRSRKILFLQKTLEKTRWKDAPTLLMHLVYCWGDSINNDL